jgi:hypothetical protein
MPSKRHSSPYDTGLVDGRLAVRRWESSRVAYRFRRELVPIVMMIFLE